MITRSLVIFSFFSASLCASPAIYSFSGTVYSSSVASASIGTPFSGTFSYDPGDPAGFAPGTNYSFWDNPSGALQVSVGGVTLTSNGGFQNIEATTPIPTNGQYTDNVYFNFYSTLVNGALPPPSGASGVLIYLDAPHSGSSNYYELPQSLPPISDLDVAEIYFGIGSQSISGNITALTELPQVAAVPEPSPSIFLVSAGLVCLAREITRRKALAVRAVTASPGS